MKCLSFATLSVMLACAAHSGAALLLDSPLHGDQTRSANNGYGRHIVVDSGVQANLSELRIHFDPNGNGALTFALYRHNSDSTHTMVGSPVTVNFTDTGFGWYSSGSLNWTLEAGAEYDIGAYANVSGNYSYNTTGGSSSGLTALTDLPRFSSTAAPTHSTVNDGALQLYGDIQAVPEPTNIALGAFALIFGGSYCVRRFRRSKA